MVTIALLLAGVALLAWPAHAGMAMGPPAPGPPPTSRARRFPAWPLSARRSPARSWPAAAWASPSRWAPPAAAGAAGLWVSVPCGVAAAIVSLTAAVLVRRARVARRSRAELTAATAALRALARDLRSGTSPEIAVRNAAASAPPEVASVLSALPGPPGAGYVTAGAPDAAPGSVRADVRSRLRAGWDLSLAHGVPLAAVTAAVAADLDDRARGADARAAQVAGPAVSGYVLAGLPAAGLLLGAGMGTHPLAVLTGSPLGGGLLLAGTVLCCAGLLWSDRLVRR